MDNDSSSTSVTDRKKLEQLISSESLDQLLQVIGSKAWLAIWCCFALLFIGISWSFLGAIPVKVRGIGISMTASGPYVVVSQADGTVTQTCVGTGEYVEKGDLLVILDNPVLAFDIKQKRDSVASKQTDLQAFTQRIEAERAARKAAILKDIESTVFALRTSENNIPFLEKDLESKRRLEEKGVIPLRVVEEARTKLEQTKIDIQNYRAMLAAQKADLDRSYRVEDIQAKIGELGTARTQLKRLELESSYLEVHAEHSGKVLEFLVAPGDRVTQGQEIASIEIPVSKGEHLNFFACFPAQYGDLLDVDLPVEIAVSGVDPKLYGFLLGKTRFLSPYPVTSAELKSSVRNAEIADFLKAGDPVVYSAVIELILDPTTKSGYAWSSKSGPPWQLSSGTIGTIQTVVQRKPPITYILPVEFSPFFFKHIRKEAKEYP